ncbi:hypothetical protein EHQ42_01870, partial [Leptospira levettii]|uniref:reverse transcriptase domain-containing protein n=1 Tax=Leptospira levettii TaxID=2023178 RepID=UPI001102EE90
MIISELNRKDINLAYKKVKSYLYYSNNTTLYKLRFAEFEKRKNLLGSTLQVLRNGTDSEEWKNLLEKIRYYSLPKKFKTEPESKKRIFIFNTENIDEPLEVDSIFYYIDCPVEIHIISMLWTIKRGVYLDKDLDSFIYGNRLFHTEQKNDSLQTFEKYYIKYTEWRDKAIENSLLLHSQKRSSCILSLDFKDYYHSIDLNEKLFSSIESSSYNFLDKFIFSISSSYSKLFGKENKILPIGLTSSNILANYYLKDIDYAFQNKFTPFYYGRYVDD